MPSKEQSEVMKWNLLRYKQYEEQLAKTRKANKEQEEAATAGTEVGWGDYSLKSMEHLNNLILHLSANSTLDFQGEWDCSGTRVGESEQALRLQRQGTNIKTESLNQLECCVAVHEFNCKSTLA